MAEHLVAADESREAVLEWIDGVADRFEAAWRAGPPPRIADFLGSAAGNRRTALVRELALIDLEYRRLCDDGWSFANYLDEFPEIAREWSASRDTPAAVDTGRPTDGRGDPGRPPPPACPGYEILETLGAGGMGVVYKARHRALKRTVALKVIVAGAHAGPDARARFWTEAKAIARLQHPNIVQIYEIGAHDDTPFFALEYVAGGSLARRLDGRPRAAHEAATLVEQLARAIHYAHQQGIVHRDLKPANVLLPSAPPAAAGLKPGSGEFGAGNPKPKIVDFGLAKLLDANEHQTNTGAVLGTPSYMAPEQAAGLSKEVGPATDIYALGAILYEMLAGRPPFRGLTAIHTLEQVRTAEPLPPGRLQPTVPRDLETVCLKCLAKSPVARYRDAAALADDLRRFLEGRPIVARPVGPMARTWRWARRKPLAAALVAAGAALTGALFVIVVLVAGALHVRAESRQRELDAQKLAGLIQGTRRPGWSAEAARLAQAASRGTDTPPRDLALASLAGLDVHLVKRFEGFGASALAFDAARARLVMGGRDGADGQPREGAKVWSGTGEALNVSETAGAGPVAVRSDGTAVQLVGRGGDRPRLLLWDVDRQRAVCTGEFPQPVGVARSACGEPVLALTPDGRWFAAAADAPGVAVWDGNTGKCVFSAAMRATTIALSPSGPLLAAGDADGRIHFWSLPDGRRTTVQTSSGASLCMTFRADGKRLAVGNDSGTVTVWDVDTRLPVAFCRGSHGAIHTTAFSPDGTLLATGGAERARVWDPTSGRQVLELSHGHSTASVAFSGDGTRLAAATDSPGHVFVYELEYDRGVRTLRGLTGPVSALGVSNDSSSVAALAQNWQAAIWDGRTGRLRRTFDVPRDGAALGAELALSADGRQLALATSRRAHLWDTATGETLASWSLPTGRLNCLLFGAGGELFLFRVEPAMNATPVGRARDLLSPEPLCIRGEFREFNRHFLAARAVPDGKHVVVEGIRAGPDGLTRSVAILDAGHAVERCSVRSTRTALDGLLVPDATGQTVAFLAGNEAGRATRLDVAGGGLGRPLDDLPMAFNQESLYKVSLGRPSHGRRPAALTLGRLTGDPFSIVLEADAAPACRPVFDATGNVLAWSRPDGLVHLCDLQETRVRLSGTGLGW